MEETIKHPVGGQILIDDKTVLASINSGVPFITGPRSLPPVQGVLELAQKIRDEFAPKEAAGTDDKKKKVGKTSMLFERK